MEPAPDRPLIRRADDVSGLIESCLSARATGALLYPANLPERFFDLSSGEAGAILQKLRHYRIRVAVVADRANFSRHFGEVKWRNGAKDTLLFSPRPRRVASGSTKWERSKDESVVRAIVPADSLSSESSRSAQPRLAAPR